MKKKLIFGFAFLVLVSFILLVFAQGGVTVSLTEPASGSWSTFPVNLNFTPSGNSTDTNNVPGYNCTLFADFNGTWNLTWTGALTPHNISHVADSTKQNLSIQADLKDNNSGYTWNVGCINNLTGAGQALSFGTNRTFKLDSTVPTTPRIDTPVNGSTIGATNPFINWTTSGDLNFKRYTVQFANDSDFDEVDIVKQQLINLNTTNSITFSQSLDGNRLYYLRVVAEDEAGNNAWQFINVTIVTSAPTIEIVNYADNTYLNTGNAVFNIIATHQFLDNCQLLTSNVTNGTFLANETSWSINVTNTSRVNGTIKFSPTTAFKNGTVRWSVRCNNTGGNYSPFTTNRTLIVDTVAPDPFGCIAPANNTKSIDHTPELRWNASTDIGFGSYNTFGNYTVTIDNNSDFSAPEFVLNITNNDTFVVADVRSYNSADRNWYWRVNSSDKAGNLRVSTNCSDFYYRTDTTNHFLKSGWNIVAIIQSGTINASDIGSGLVPSWTTISKYNSSKQFQNYNNGSATNGGMLFRKGDAIFVNVNADTYWENQTWDTSNAYTNDALFNLSNSSGGWNAFGMQNQTGLTIGQIERGILLSNTYRTGGDGISNGTYYYEFKNVTLPNNDSIQSLVYFNNTAISTRKYVLHPFNYSVNNDTRIDYGEVIWININASINGTSNLMIVNLTFMGELQ